MYISLSNMYFLNSFLHFETFRYREQKDLAFTLLVKSQHLNEPVNLADLLKYSMSPVPHSIGTADGFFYKTNKASLIDAVTPLGRFLNLL